MLGERATDENIERVREQLGLNRPLFLNLPYTVEYNCPEDYDGSILDLIVVTFPATCERQASHQDGWALLRINETDTVTAYRVIDPGTPNETTEEPDLRTTLRLIGVRELAELNLEPDVAQEFEVYNGTITVSLRTERALFSDLLDSQYFIFLGRILRGDLGRSIQGNIPIGDDFARRFPATIELSIAALAIAILVGVPIGIVSAVRRNSWVDTFSMFLALLGVSLPIFVLGLLLIYLFGVQLGWLPTGQRLSATLSLEPITGFLLLDALLRGNGEVFSDALSHILLPAFALSTIPLSIIARITRSSMLEVLHQDYIRTARAKGLRERVVVLRHAMRNALLPVVTVIGLAMGSLLAGAVLTETIFSWQGIGKWLFDSIEGRDYPIVQSVSLMITLVYVVVNLIVDLSYAWLNPRIRYE
ncbi:MAG: ABC transporter permease [Anaerolineae bacterium]|nr:ABC transporter permease [Anaerolineae bacterium]